MRTAVALAARLAGAAAGGAPILPAAARAGARSRAEPAAAALASRAVHASVGERRGGRAAAASPTADDASTDPAPSCLRPSAPHAPARDYYDVLGVPKGAPDADVKRAYYRLAKAHHPDTNPGDAAAAAKFQEATRAYDALRDPQKRALYDALGSADEFEAAEKGGGGGAGPRAGGPFGGAPGSSGVPPDVEDVFAAFFGGLGGRGGFRAAGFGGGFPGGGFGFAAPDARVGLRIPFDLAARGGRRTLNVGGGDGGAVEVDIPAGVDTGATLRLAGRGPRPPPGAPAGTPAGDLLVQLEVEASPTFGRAGADVTVSAAVDFWDAALGATVTVPTPLDGEVKLALKPGTQPGDRLRMRGYGLPRPTARARSPSPPPPGAGRGDQYVRVAVRVPRALTPAAADLVRRLRDEVKGGGKRDGANAKAA